VNARMTVAASMGNVKIASLLFVLRLLPREAASGDVILTSWGMRPGTPSRIAPPENTPCHPFETLTAGSRYSLQPAAPRPS
jgi:hypothetical protein